MSKKGNKVHNNFANASHFFVHFFAITEWLRHESAQFYVLWREKHKTTNFFFPWTLIESLGFSSRKTFFPDEWAHKEGRNKYWILTAQDTTGPQGSIYHMLILWQGFWSNLDLVSYFFLSTLLCLAAKTNCPFLLEVIVNSKFYLVSLVIDAVMNSHVLYRKRHRFCWKSEEIMSTAPLLLHRLILQIPLQVSVAAFSSFLFDSYPSSALLWWWWHYFRSSSCSVSRTEK